VRGGSDGVAAGQSRGYTWRGGWRLMTRYEVAVTAWQLANQEAIRGVAAGG
nr:hypothetical protein [Tanacetum cinerariifolium]